MASDSSFPTPGQLVDSVPLIRNPGFWVPKPVELPPDIHPLPEDIHAYFVYPHTLEAHVLSTLPAALDSLQQTHAQRIALLASYSESKERARKARLNQLAPGYAEGAAALEPVRKGNTTTTTGPEQANPRLNSMMHTLSELRARSPDHEAPASAGQAEGSVLGEARASSPSEMGQATMDQMQRDQMMDMFSGLDRLDSTLGSNSGVERTGTSFHPDVADLI